MACAAFFDNTFDSDGVFRTSRCTDLAGVTQGFIPDDFTGRANFLSSERNTLDLQSRTERGTDTTDIALLFVDDQRGLSVKSGLALGTIGDLTLVNRDAGTGFTAGGAADAFVFINLSGEVILRETFLFLDRKACFTVNSDLKGVKRTQNRTDTAVGTLRGVNRDRGFVFDGTAADGTDKTKDNCFLGTDFGTDTASGTFGRV